MNEAPDTDLDPIEAYRLAVERASLAAVESAAGTDIVSASGVESAVVMKSRLASVHKQVAQARRDALAAQETAKAAVEVKKRELDAMMHAMQEQLEPLQKQMARYEDGIRAFNLYLGRDEEIIQVRDGKPAPADTPVQLRQMTLAMDEESALNADTNGIDFQNIDLFVAWLTADDAHIDQLIGETKGIVAIRPRRTSKDYSGNPWADAEKNSANWQTHWLIRNGEQVWLTTTDFRVGDRMVTKADEFTKMFTIRDHDGAVVKLQPGSKEWASAEALADAYTRHYMKAALVLQGLVDRTKVLHPLPEGGLSFLEQSFYDSGAVQVIADDELAITVARQPFFEWLKERATRLETGMRVIGAFDGYSTGFRSSDDFRGYERANVRPQGEVPGDGAYVIKRINDSHFEFSFSFGRTREVFDKKSWEYRPAKTKATCFFSAGDHFVIPIDTVTVEEMQDYLDARTERHVYATMFPILQAAVKFKFVEADEERPFLNALTARLILLDKVMNVDEGARAAAEVEASELIAWYKTANRWHRALEPEDAKASKLILTEARRRRSGVDKDGDALTAIRTSWKTAGDGRGIMAIARRSSDYVAVIPESRTYPAPAVAQDVFVTMLVCTSAGVEKERRRWVNLTHAQIARWTVLDQDERWADWTIGASSKTHLSDPEIDDVLAWVFAQTHEGTPFIIRWSETGRDDNRDELKILVTLTGDADATPERGVVVERGTDGIVVRLGGKRKSTWSNWHHDHPSWQTAYWGEVRPKKTIWQDTAVEAAELKRWETWCDAQRVAQATSNTAHALVNRISRAWVARAWEILRQRYISDFGDDELWDEHKKGLTAPRYPHEDRFDSRWDKDKPWGLYRVVHALVEDGRAPYDQTVAEAIAAWGGSNMNIPDDVLELRFTGAG